MTVVVFSIAIRRKDNKRHVIGAGYRNPDPAESARGRIANVGHKRRARRLSLNSTKIESGCVVSKGALNTGSTCARDSRGRNSKPPG
jgi:hypothetical protein